MALAVSSAKKNRSRYRGALKHMESLEPRTFLSVTPVSYIVPGVAAGFAVYDSSGSLWVYDSDEPVTPVLKRIKDKAVDTAPNSVIPMDSPTYLPSNFAAGPNGHLYAEDWNAGMVAIDDIDLATGTITQIPVTMGGTSSSLTVTDDGSVWFTMWDTSSTLPLVNMNTVARMDPSTHAITTYTFDSSVSDSTIGVVTPNGSDSVWVSLGACDYYTESGISNGTTRIATVSYAGGQFAANVYGMNTGTAADVNGNLSGLVSDRDGGVWFGLSNSPYNMRPGSSPDAIVHGTFDNSGNLVQTAYVAPGTSLDTPRMYSFFSTDNSGGIWFISTGTNAIGTFDGSNWEFFPNDVQGLWLGAISANHDGSQMTINTGSMMDPDTGELLYQGDPPLIELDFAPAPITFQGEAYNVNIKEDTALSGTLLATFAAPTPASTYSATITWGDGTTTNVAPTLVGDNTYAIVVSGKKFATQGTFTGSIAIKDGTTATGTLSFTSVVSDIPLNVTSFNVTPLILRIAAATGTFTDDADLSTSTWTATIKWGDNTTSTGLIVRDPTQAGRYLVIALHQYRTRGTYTARLTVTTTETAAAILNATLTTTVSVR